MKMKALPKMFERKGASTPWLHNDKYITNGHFLVPRALIKEDFKYCPPLGIARQDNLERVIPSEESTQFVYKKTNRLFDYGDFLVREFECADHFADEGKTAYFREDYVKFFEIDELNGSNPLNPFICLANNVVIMPCRSPK